MLTQPREGATVPDRPIEPTVRSRSRSADDRVASFDSWAIAATPGLLRFAAVVSGSPHTAADIVQDALVAVYPRWARLAEPGSADAYARRVIVNRHISRWRKWGRREQSTDHQALEAAAGPAPDASASDAVVARTVLMSLPPRHRAAVVLRFYDDLAYAEMADILHCTESTARSYVHRALGQLRRELEIGTDDD